MSETNKRDREAMTRWVRMCVDDDGMAPELLAAIRDADRLQRIERQVRELVDEWECEADNPSTTIVGDPDDIYRNLATALRAIVDTGSNDDA